MNILGISSGTQLWWCFAIGFMTACVWAFFAKFFAGRLVCALVREDACDEASAKTLAQLGCSGPAYRFALRRGTALAEAVPEASGDGLEKRYYLKPEAKEKMLMKYGKENRGFLSLILTLLAALIAASIVAMLLPFVTDRLGL